MLELKNVSYAYRDQLIFKDLNLKINKNEFVVVIGSNGAGKSTLVNLISGNLIPLKGEVCIGNKVVNKLDEIQRSKYIAKVFQSPDKSTNGNLTLMENMALANLRGKNKSIFPFLSKSLKLKVDEELKKIKIDFRHKMNSPLTDFSGGQRQCLALLMSRLAKSEILLLDEHTSALDPKMADEVMEITNTTIRNENLTCFMITHNLRYAAKYGDRLIFLHQGKVLYDFNQEEKKKINEQDLSVIFNKAIYS